MRDTYIPTQEHPESSRAENAAASRRSLPPAARVSVAVVFDIATVAFVASLLWLGAGATVFAGEPLPMAVAFAGGVVLAAAAWSSARVDAAGAPLAGSLRGILSTVLLVGAYVLATLGFDHYYFAWVVLFGGVYTAVTGAVQLIAVAFRRQRVVYPIGSISALAGGTAVSLLLHSVWLESGILADLIVFTVLLVGIAAALEIFVHAVRGEKH